jgi:hypothetical protein
MNPQTHEYMKELESQGKIDLTCKTCIEHFYPQLRLGKKFHEIFAPRHQALATCKSGKYNHCSCDTCF